mmetsp:Transcript_25294/g.66145  ORF Transcript_25294/g.66145 Transcript_25294/m.66145 type:complete len:757 (+) Transcript_25294:91-2361(+)
MAAINGKGAVVIKAGHLTKLGGTRKNWKKRWFVLTEGLVAYYSKPNGALKGTIPVGLIAGVRRARTQAECSRKYALLVQTVDRKYQFQANNSGERDEWIEAISSVLPSKGAPTTTMDAPPLMAEAVEPVTPVATAEPAPADQAEPATSEDGGEIDEKPLVAAAAAAAAISVEETPDAALVEVHEVEDIDEDLRRSNSEAGIKTPDNLNDPRLKPHIHAVSQPYGNADVQPPVQRFEIPDDMHSWATELPEYAPTDFTDASVLSKPVWADISEDGPNLAYNEFDEGCKVDRTSYEGVYKLDPKTGLPLNPRGRTGVCGRGKLGRFGPNHAADPIVSRWKVDPDTGMKVIRNGEKVLEFVAIKRRDGGEWALPGGMVDPGESVSVTLKREFGEEALNSFELEEKQRLSLKHQLDELFSTGHPLYRGYVDDRRNTDNAWMETTCVSIHDETGDTFQLFPLSSGDDAIDVTWIEYSEDLKLYANHVHFLALAWHYHMRPDQYEPPPVGGMRMFRVNSVKVARRKGTNGAAAPAPEEVTPNGEAADAAGPAAVSSALHLGVHATVNDDSVPEFVEHTLRNAAATKDEEGAFDFMVLQEEGAPNHVAVLEVYRDESAIAAHGETEHCEAWRASTKPLCSRTKAKWTVLPGGGADGRLIPEDAPGGECMARLVDIEVEADQLQEAIVLVTAFIAGMIPADGVHGRALQQLADWDGVPERLRLQCVYTSREALENHAVDVTDLLLSLEAMKVGEPKQTVFSVLA